MATPIAIPAATPMTKPVPNPRLEVADGVGPGADGSAGTNHITTNAIVQIPPTINAVIHSHRGFFAIPVSCVPFPVSCCIDTGSPVSRFSGCPLVPEQAVEDHVEHRVASTDVLALDAFLHEPDLLEHALRRVIAGEHLRVDSRQR